jgi:hypothetical protein
MDTAIKESFENAKGREFPWPGKAHALEYLMVYHRLAHTAE